ncbi:MAG: hypothetical protein FJ267_02015 [Planctomycetes bacterium]|nr:hypothetical protein [Planctomycetota bacterium]
MESKKFLTAAEASIEFGISENDLNRFVTNGELRALPDRNVMKFSRDEIQALVNAGKIAPLTSEIWIDDEVDLSETLPPIVPSPDDISYIELDEEALEEHATKANPTQPIENRTPVDEVAVSFDWIDDDPKSAKTDVEQSVKSRPAPAFQEPPQSDSDVRIIYDFPESRQRQGSENVLVDSDVPSTSRSDSDVRIMGSQSDLASGTIKIAPDKFGDSDSDVKIAASLRDSDSDVRISPLLGSDSDVRLVSKTDEFSIPSKMEVDLNSTMKLGDSDSDVQIADSRIELKRDREPLKKDSDSDVQLAQPTSGLDHQLSQTIELIDSDSDVKIGGEVPSGMEEGSGIVLDFDIGAGATVSSSGSSLRLPETSLTDDDEITLDDSLDDLDMTTPIEVPTIDDPGLKAGSRSKPSLANQTPSESGEWITVGDDDDDAASLFASDQSGIALDGGSHLGSHPTGSSILVGGSVDLAGDSAVTVGVGASAPDDSGINLDDLDLGGDSQIALERTGSPSAIDPRNSLDSTDVDSGVSLVEADDRITLDAGDSGISIAAGDSGISLADGDSGISLDAGDSGITLDAGDSGISIGASDSGISLEGGDSGIRLSADDKTAAIPSSKATVPYGKRGTAADTGELFVDEDDFETMPVAGKNTAGLTDAFEMDDAPSVEDLDIAEDLDKSFSQHEDEVVEIEDEHFDEEHDEVEDDEALLAAEEERKKVKTGPREPAWGMLMASGLVASTGVLLMNGMMIWSGISTMWSGADPSFPASIFLGLFGGR